jgi:nucleotide-binding universal stress UspA family protein
VGLTLFGATPFGRSTVLNFPRSQGFFRRLLTDCLPRTAIRETAQCSADGANSFALATTRGLQATAERVPNHGTCVAHTACIELEALMNVRPSILCPIDYSEASAGALRYAAAIAEHFVTRLIVLTVEDPLLTAAMDLGTGVRWTPEASEGEIAKFVMSTFGDDESTIAMCEYEVAVGKPPVEILRIARERSCDLIVMSSHGLTGARKLFFGTTTERVLRETTVPVLVTPPVNPGPVHVEGARQLLGRIVAPIDFSPSSLHQAQVAGGLAEAFDLPLILVHVIEPMRSRLVSRFNIGGLDTSRRAVAEDAFNDLLAKIPRFKPEALVVYGDPAEETAKVVRDRQAGLVIMGLHGSPTLGPRMGSVTYRVLCLSPTLVLALPPNEVQASGKPVHEYAQVAGAIRR